MEIQAPLAIAARAEVGTPLTIASAGASGKLIAVGRSVDPASQSVLLRGLVTQGAEALRPGQATSVDLALGNATETTVQVPGSAILRHENKPWVFVAARAGTATGYRATAVTIIGRTGEATVVSGIPADATVATAGVSALKASWLGIGKE